MGIEITPPGTPILLGGALAGVVPVNAAASTPASATAAVNTQVQITVNGSSGWNVRITHLSGSYSAAPTGGTLTVVVNAVTIFQADITAAGQFSIALPPGGLVCQSAQNAVITLTAAGAAVAGRLNVGSILGV